MHTILCLITITYYFLSITLKNYLLSISFNYIHINININNLDHVLCHPESYRHAFMFVKIINIADSV